MSPIGKYFKNHGRQVLSDMQDRYGDKKGTSVFYATSNKHPEMKPGKQKRKSFGARIAERPGD